jgi:hypothetical protein
MAIINTGKTFTATETVTNTKLQDIANEATFNDPADETSLELIPTGINAGKLGVKDAGITPAKLSAGAPSWGAGGTFFTDNVTGKETTNSLTLRADPESPDPVVGGAQLALFSSDSIVPNQIYVKSSFIYFDTVAATPARFAGINPNGPQVVKDLTTKEYVDGTSSFTTEDGQSAGYQVFPSGLKMAWGSATTSSFPTQGGTVTFPLNATGGTLFDEIPTVQLTYNDEDINQFATKCKFVTRTNFENYSQSTTDPGRYLAIGI